MKRAARIVLAAMVALVGVAAGVAAFGCAHRKPEPPAWRWSEPYYAPPGANVACGAGGKACR